MSVSFADLTTLFFSIGAFGGGLPFATVGTVLLVGSSVTRATPVVFLYRLYTSRVPILPGRLWYQWLGRIEYP